jgi:hypothetical protein
MVHDAEDSSEVEAGVGEFMGRRVFDEIPVAEVKRLVLFCIGGCWSVLNGELQQWVAGIEPRVVKGTAEFTVQEMGKTPVSAAEIEDTHRSVLLQF